MRSFAAAIGIGMSFATLTAQALPKLVIERELVLRGATGRCAVRSSDGTRLASCGACGDVLFVDAATGTVQREVLAARGPIDDASFAVDHRTLAVVATNGGLTFVDVATGVCSSMPGATVQAFAWSHDGEHFAIVDAAGQLALHRCSDRSIVRTTKLRERAERSGIAFSPDDLRIAIAVDDSCLVVSRVTGAMLDNFGLVRGTPTKTLADESLDLRPADGEHVRPWLSWTKSDVRTPPAAALPNALLPHRRSPSDAVPTGDGRFVAVSDTDSTVHVFDATGDPLQLPSPIRGALVPDGENDVLTVLQTVDPEDSWRQPRTRRSDWSLDALRAKRPALVRETEVPEWSTIVASLLRSSDEASALASAALDFVGEDYASLPNGASFVPAPRGTRVLAVEDLRAKGPIEHGVLAAKLSVVDRDGNVLGTASSEPVRAAAWSRDGARIGLLGAQRIVIRDGTTLGELAVVRGAWTAFAFVDANTLLLADADSLSLQPTNGDTAIARISMPNCARRVTTDTNGTRAVVLLHDRALVVRVAH